MRRSLTALAAVATLVSAPALAGDAASLEILGFNAAGSVFAFEEYGVQDGSGFPYANRFFIDTATDSFVSGTPVRVRIDDEAKPVAAARADARARTQALVPDAVLAANRGYTAGFNAITEQSADPLRMAVNPRPVFPAIDTPLEFRLEEIAFPADDSCPGLESVVGFRLLRVDASPGGTTGLVHEDSSVPKSRACPTGYRLSAIQTFHPRGGEPVYAVVVSVRSIGFEGPNHRWIALTGRL